ncbi:MAG TPA: transaldolase family protein, partial [Vicinamibacteria bacterium]
MKIFLDTASVGEIREAASLGLVDGVTTNPSLLAKEKAPYREVLSEICALVEGPISAEVVATDAPGMVREGRDLAKIAPNIVVKCPLTGEGLKAVRE